MAAWVLPVLQQSLRSRRPACGDSRSIAYGSAHSLQAAGPMALWVLRGRAWVTLGAGAAGWCEASGDLVVLAGQGLCVPGGGRTVVEPLGREGLQYRWVRAAAGAKAAPTAAGPAGH